MASGNPCEISKPTGTNMMDEASLAEHWGKDDIYRRIVDALEASGKSLQSLTIEDLAPVDHFHARGFPATVELAERLPIRRGDRLLDIGCGIGGPARYLADRFDCRVDGIDITPAFIDTAARLTELLHLQGRVIFELGDGNHLPYADASFDGAYSQHVTMNVPDRPRFFGEAFRVLKPGAFFALSEHGLGPANNPHHPVPWSADGSGEYLVTPDQTRAFLDQTGFTGIEIEFTGPGYLAGYRRAIELAEQGRLPALGVHLLLGEQSLQIVRNAARNIEQDRTCPIQVICRKPGADA